MSLSSCLVPSVYFLLQVAPQCPPHRGLQNRTLLNLLTDGALQKTLAFQLRLKAIQNVDEFSNQRGDDSYMIYGEKLSLVCDLEPTANQRTPIPYTKERHFSTTSRRKRSPPLRPTFWWNVASAY